MFHAREPRRRRDERGATSAIELVLVAPVLMFAVMLIIQGALYFHARNIAEQAAQEGAASARAFEGTEAGAKQDALNYLDSLGSETFQGRSVTVNRGAEQATVTVSGNVLQLVPFVKLEVSESSTGPVERYVPPVGGP